MSSLIVEVATIQEIKVHPNADLLELAIVKGWQCVVGKGQYSVGEKIVYFPPDTVLSQTLIDIFGVSQHVHNGRIRCAKLRGEPSFGLVVSVPKHEWEVGKDVAEYFGATKYEPPMKNVQGDQESEDALFIRYTEIENLRNFPDILKVGEPVVVTEKIHGMNARVGIIDGKFMAGSHKYRRKEPEDYATNTFWWILQNENVKTLLETLSANHRQVILYGEIYGPGIQCLHYGEKKRGFAAFDLMVDGEYLGPQNFLDTCEMFGVKTVPVLLNSEAVFFNMAMVKQLAEGRDTFSNSHIREGVVIKPWLERFDPKIGRVVLKYMSDAYLLKKQDDLASE